MLQSTTRTRILRDPVQQDKYDALPDKMKAIIANAVEAASATSEGHPATPRLHRAADQGKSSLQDPRPILQKQLEVFDQSRQEAAENPLWKGDRRIAESFARARGLDQDPNISRMPITLLGKKARRKS